MAEAVRRNLSFLPNRFARHLIQMLRNRIVAFGVFSKRKIGSSRMRDESRALVRYSVCVAAVGVFVLGPYRLYTVFAAPPGGLADSMVRDAEVLSASPEAKTSSNSTNDEGSSGTIQSKLSSEQISKLKDVLRSHGKGGMNILWLSTVSVLGEQIESAFREAGWAVASLPVGMGNLPSGITITGKTNNIAVAAAKDAFNRSGIKYNYQDNDTKSISPTMMGPCDVAITVSTEPK
jgi:hypothetical protein